MTILGIKNEKYFIKNEKYFIKSFEISIMLIYNETRSKQNSGGKKWLKLHNGNTK